MSHASQLTSVCCRGNIPVILTPCKDDAWSTSTCVLGSHKTFSWYLLWLPKGAFLLLQLLAFESQGSGPMRRIKEVSGMSSRQWSPHLCSLTHSSLFPPSQFPPLWLWIWLGKKEESGGPRLEKTLAPPSAADLPLQAVAKPSPSSKRPWPPARLGRMFPAPGQAKGTVIKKEQVMETCFHYGACK